MGMFLMSIDDLSFASDHFTDEVPRRGYSAGYVRAGVPAKRIERAFEDVDRAIEFLFCLLDHGNKKPRPC